MITILLNIMSLTSKIGIFHMGLLSILILFHVWSTSIVITMKIIIFYMMICKWNRYHVHATSMLHLSTHNSIHKFVTPLFHLKLRFRQRILSWMAGLWNSTSSYVWLHHHFVVTTQSFCSNRQSFSADVDDFDLFSIN